MLQSCSILRLSVATWAELCSQPAPNPDSPPCLLIRVSAAITHVPGRVIPPKNLLWVFCALMSVCDQQSLVSGACSAHHGRSTEDFPSRGAGEHGWLQLPSRCSSCLQPVIPNLSHEKHLNGASGSAELFLVPLPLTSGAPSHQQTWNPGSEPHWELPLLLLKPQKYFCCSNWTNIFKLSTVLFSNNS